MSINPDSNIVMHIIREDGINKGIAEVLSNLRMGNIKYMDKRCASMRNYPFTYFTYDDTMIVASFNKLKKLTYSTSMHPDIWNNGIGETIIKHYYVSIMRIRRKNDISPDEVRQNQDMVNKAVMDGVINNFNDRNKLSQSFVVSDYGRRIHIVSPGVIKLLIMKYLPESILIYDPFNRYGSVELAAASLDIDCLSCCYNDDSYCDTRAMTDRVLFKDKHINSKISFHNAYYAGALNKSDSIVCIVPDSDDSYWQTSGFKSSDEFIATICSDNRVHSKKMFITDDPGSYSDYIVQELFNKADMLKKKRYVILIDK